MASHVEVPPSLLHIVSKNRGIIFYFLDVASFALFVIAPNDSCFMLFLKMEQSRSYQIDTSKN